MSTELILMVGVLAAGLVLVFALIGLIYAEVKKGRPDQQEPA